MASRNPYEFHSRGFAVSPDGEHRCILHRRRILHLYRYGIGGGGEVAGELLHLLTLGILRTPLHHQKYLLGESGEITFELRQDVVIDN